MLYLKLHSGLLSYCKSLKRQNWQMIQCPYNQKSCQSRGSCPSFPSLRECWSPFAVRPTRGSVQPVFSLPSRAATSCPATNLTPRRQAKNALHYVPFAVMWPRPLVMMHHADRLPGEGNITVALRRSATFIQRTLNGGCHAERYFVRPNRIDQIGVYCRFAHH